MGLISRVSSRTYRSFTMAKYARNKNRQVDRQLGLRKDTFKNIEEKEKPKKITRKEKGPKQGGMKKVIREQNKQRSKFMSRKNLLKSSKKMKKFLKKFPGEKPDGDCLKGCCEVKMNDA